MWREIVSILLFMLIGIGVAGNGVCSEECMAVVSIRTLRKEYSEKYIIGGELFAHRNDMRCVALTCEDDSNKQVTDIKALINRTRGDAVFFVDANTEMIIPEIAEIFEEAGVYWVSWWNKPRDIKVWNYEYWVSHITFDPVAAGEYVAEELIKSIGGKGKIVALKGSGGVTVNYGRCKGLYDILTKYPDVELVEVERADWDRGLGYEKLEKMLKNHPDLVGVWAANDSMALGALDYLREHDLDGKIKLVGIDGLPEMLEAVRDGEAVATVYNDYKYLAGIGLSIAHGAKIGSIWVSKLDRKFRQFYASSIEVNRANVEQIIREYIVDNPEYDYNNYFASYVRAIE